MKLAKGTLRLIAGFLVMFCITIASGILLNTVYLCLDVPVIISTSEEGLLHPDVLRYIAVSMCWIMLDCIILIAFIQFAISIVRKRVFFSRGQTVKLVIIASSMLVRTLLGLAYPTIHIPEMVGGFIGPVAIAPMLDLRLLSFSFMFFALAGIFEYGRILQEDSDNIL